jgi:hypothetical protein
LFDGPVDSPRHRENFSQIYVSAFAIVNVLSVSGFALCPGFAEKVRSRLAFFELFNPKRRIIPSTSTEFGNIRAEKAAAEKACGAVVPLVSSPFSRFGSGSCFVSCFASLS